MIFAQTHVTIQMYILFSFIVLLVVAEPKNTKKRFPKAKTEKELDLPFPPNDVTCSNENQKSLKSQGL